MIRERESRAGGFTLVEILVTVSIMGIAMSGIFQALSTFLNAGMIERSVANVDVALRTYSERVIAAPYVNCASIYSVVTLPSGYSFSVAPTISYWNVTIPQHSTRPVRATRACSGSPRRFGIIRPVRPNR